MRRTASEVVNELESRIARLEKSAIFGLFRNKDQDAEGLSLKERNIRRRQREEDDSRERQKSEDRKRQKRLNKMSKEAQRHYEKFMDKLQYELFKKVDDIDLEMKRGNISGVITMGQFEYKIISELAEPVLGMDVRATITVIGPGIRRDNLSSRPVVYGLRSKFDDEVVFSHDAEGVAHDLFKGLKKAMGIAHSDNAVSDRSERKRMRKEKYRLANRRSDY